MRIIDVLTGGDVLTYEPPENVHGILAAPPCTQFSVSGARWWATKPPELLVEAKEVVRACLRIIEAAQPSWWALENPVGRLKREVPELGEYAYTWQPYEYGDPWVKRTCIWGQHTAPHRCPVAIPEYRTEKRWQHSLTDHLSPKPTGAQIAKLVATGMLPPDWVHRLGPSPARATLRSITPPGYARAFFEANP